MYTIARHFVSPIAARYTDNIVFLAYSLIAIEFFPAISFPGRRQSAIAISRITGFLILRSKCDVATSQPLGCGAQTIARAQ